MAKAVLNNSETGADIRGKINDNFTELYNQAEVVAALSADTTLDATHGTVKVDATAGNKVITLPASGMPNGKIYRTQKSDASANTVELAGNGKTINGETSIIISYQNSCASVQYDGTNWILI